MKKEILLAFCTDPSRDPVAHHVWRACLAMYTPLPCLDRKIEDKPVLRFQTRRGNEIYLAATSDVVSHDYTRFRDDLNRDFGTAEVIAIVNWHEGQHAPDRIFCAHTTADVPGGVFGPASGATLNAMLKALEHRRSDAGLNDWRVLGEASHWSGIMHGAAPRQILEVKAPVIDVEIGSQAGEWNNPAAHAVMAAALGEFADLEDQRLPSFVFFGGVHFEPAVTEAVFAKDRPCVQFGHHLPNHWLVSGQYDKAEGLDLMIKAAKSVLGGIDGFAFHDSLKGPYKANVREAAVRLGIPVLSHKKLRDVEYMRATFPGVTS